MLLIPGVNLDLDPCMRLALDTADKIFQQYAGREAIVTSARDREHYTGSFHYYGLAFDLRIKDIDGHIIGTIVAELKQLLPSFDIIRESTHIHIEAGAELGFEKGAYTR